MVVVEHGGWRGYMPGNQGEIYGCSCAAKYSFIGYIQDIAQHSDPVLVRDFAAGYAWEYHNVVISFEIIGARNPT